MIGEDSPEQIKTLPQAVLCGVFLQHLVVLADGGEEHDEQDVFKTMDPLTTFTPLSANVNLWNTTVNIFKVQLFSLF